MPSLVMPISFRSSRVISLMKSILS